MTPEPTPLLEQSIEQRRAESAAHRLEQAEGQLRAARRAQEMREQDCDMLTLRCVQRIEKLLERLLDGSA